MLDKTNIFKIAKPPVSRIVQTIPQIKTANKYLGEICTVSIRSLYTPQNITTTLRNKLGKTLGTEEFYMYEETGKASGAMIYVEPEYRQKNFRFGEILRLSSIMMMIENKIKEFEIFSKNTAIFFHNKYKFEPAIITFSERNQALEAILENCKNKVEYDDIYKEANELIERCITKKETEASSQRDLCKKTNDLLKIYMKKITKNNDYKEHPFSNGMRMILTEENIKENKDFFNELYKKHRIDYKI